MSLLYTHNTITLRSSDSDRNKTRHGRLAAWHAKTNHSAVNRSHSAVRSCPEHDHGHTHVAASTQCLSSCLIVTTAPGEILFRPMKIQYLKSTSIAMGMMPTNSTMFSSSTSMP